MSGERRDGLKRNTPIFDFMVKTKYDAIYTSITDNINTDNMIILWNHFCEDYNRMDDYIEAMYLFNDAMYGREPIDIAQMITYGKFHADDDYYFFNGHGNIVTFSRWSDYDTPIELSEMIEYIEENYHDFDDILDFLLDDEDIKDEFVAYVNGYCNTNLTYEGITLALEDYYEFNNVIEDDWEYVAEMVLSYVEEHK